MPETPVQKSGFDGTGVTEAVCPKHGKERTVSADSLFVAGADPRTLAARCLEPVTEPAKKAAKDGGPTIPAVATTNTAAFSPGASYALTGNEHYCQEFLVPVESRDAEGYTVRKNGKLVDEGEIERQRTAKTKQAERESDAREEEGGTRVAVGGAYQGDAGETGGQKLARASGAVEEKKGAKRTAKKSSTSAKRSSKKKAA